MIPRRIPSFALALALAFACGRSTVAGETATSDSAHYHLVSTGSQQEADEWTRVLEAAWPQYAEFFGKAPTLAKGERLNVAFFETNADMQAAIRNVGGSPPEDAGGYYEPTAKTAFLYRQPTIWFTRALLLHECAHQFHYRSKGLTTLPSFWYAEGIADHLARHTWDGERLRIGVVPMLSLENYPAAALKTLTSGAFDFDKVFDGKAECGRPEAMHLVRYLCQAEGGKLRPKLDAVGLVIERGAKVGAKGCVAAFGPTKKLAAAITAWLPSVQEPWEYLTNEWDNRRADALRGFSPDVVALCRRRAETKRLSARMCPVGTAGFKGGLLLRYTAPDDYDIAMIGKRVYVDRRKDGAWRRLAEVDAPAGEAGTWRIEAVRDGGSVKFIVSGQEVATIEAPSGSMGLAVDASTVDFTEIAAE